MAAGWKSVGFVHGVINTDNLPLLGDAIDFGTFCFVESFDENFMPNHSDHRTRYSWGAQEPALKWGLHRLALALDRIGVLPTEVSLKYLSADADAAVADEDAKQDDFPYQATAAVRTFASCATSAGATPRIWWRALAPTWTLSKGMGVRRCSMR